MHSHLLAIGSLHTSPAEEPFLHAEQKLLALGASAAGGNAKACAMNSAMDIPQALPIHDGVLQASRMWWTLGALSKSCWPRGPGLHAMKCAGSARPRRPSVRDVLGAQAPATATGAIACICEKAKQMCMLYNIPT